MMYSALCRTFFSFLESCGMELHCVCASGSHSLAYRCNNSDVLGLFLGDDIEKWINDVGIGGVCYAEVSITAQAPGDIRAIISD